MVYNAVYVVGLRSRFHDLSLLARFTLGKELHRPIFALVKIVGTRKNRRNLQGVGGKKSKGTFKSVIFASCLENKKRILTKRFANFTLLSFLKCP